MMGNKQTLSASLQSCFQFGPLKYALIPHDPWGERTIRSLQSTLKTKKETALCTRMVHLCREPGESSCPIGELPPSLRRLSPADGRASWKRTRSQLGCTWHSSNASHAFWSDGASPELGDFRFQLPWGLLLEDIAAQGGGLMHGGLAVHRGRALLFLAPPGGGKSTTLATTPAEWQALSDDAALVWPQGENWFASPIPSWTSMTASKRIPSLFDPAPRHQIGGLLVLVKGTALGLTRLSAKDAAAPVFRGLTEYPATVISELPLTEHFFRTACNMARALPCWRLELPLGGDCWPLLAEQLA